VDVDVDVDGDGDGVLRALRGVVDDAVAVVVLPLSHTSAGSGVCRATHVMVSKRNTEPHPDAPPMARARARRLRLSASRRCAALEQGRQLVLRDFDTE
jgi:hypothetical protein